MFLERHGRGPRIFLGLHGWSGSHRTFDPLLTSLPEDVSFYAADLPGCGESEPPTIWTLQHVAERVAEAARWLPGPFTLVGNCSGGLLGMLAAKRIPELVERMLLIDLLASMPWYFKIFLTPVLGPVAYYSTFANPAGRWIANASLKSHRTEKTTLTGGFAGASHRVTYQYLKLFEKFPGPVNFTSLTMPIDIVYGERTFAAVRASLPVWRSVWPQAEVRQLPGAGHLPILEATDVLREILFSCPIPTISRS